MTSAYPPPPSLASLPAMLPVFPLSGAVLLPQARLPLNIFEPRYLAMVEDALGHGRLIGMIQPSGDENAAVPPLYAVGCVGRITSFSETDDGRMMIVLSGVCRFRVAAELPSTRLYRSVAPDWTPYHHDLVEDDATAVNRDRLFGLLQIYFKKHGIGVDWKMVQNAPDDVLVSTAIMISPLPVAEKQALLEAATFADRTAMLEALLEMAVMPQGDAEGEMRH